MAVAVQALDDLRADRRLLAEPDRRQQHEDVGGHDLLVDRRPVVALPAVLGHVGLDAGRDVVVDRADDVDRDAVALHDRDRAVGERLRVRDLRRALERAVDVQRAQVGEVPGRCRAELLVDLGQVGAPLAAVSYLALRGVRRALDVNEETCVCIGGVLQVATYMPGAGAVRLTTGVLVTMDQLESCERRYTGTVLGFGVQAVVNKLHVLSGGTVGFARGLNDTPKIVALLIGAQALGPTAGLALVTVAMAIGGVLGARRVARTMAFGITGMNHGQGFAANLVTSLLVTLASPLGLPVSTTHVSCGALFGIGLVNREARGKTIRDIVTAWVTTLPVAASLAAATAAVLPLVVGSR